LINKNNTIHIQSLEDVYKDIKETQCEENIIKTYVIQSGDLTQVLMKMVNGAPSYIPYVAFDNEVNFIKIYGWTSRSDYQSVF
jgi:hypothetical protein